MGRLIKTDNGTAFSLNPTGTNTQTAKESGGGRLVRIDTPTAAQAVQTAPSPAPDYRKAVELNRMNRELNQLEKQQTVVTEAPRGGRLARIDTPTAAQAVQTVSSPAPNYRRAVELNRMNRELNQLKKQQAQAVVAEMPSGGQLVDWLEQQRAEWMEPISQRSQISQISQPTLSAVTPIFSPSEERSKAGRTATPKAEEPPRHVPENSNEGFFSRLGNTVSGGVKEFFSKHMDTQGVLYQGSQKTRIDNYEDMLALEQASADREYQGLAELLAKDGLTVEVFEGMPEDDGFFSSDQRDYLIGKGVSNPDDVLASFRLWQSARQKADAYRQSIGVQPKAAEAARELADMVRKSGEEDIARAKDGLGGFGQLVVDTSVIGGQMVGDAALGKLTDASADLPMVIRIFGEAAQEARRDGADIDQQMLNGYGSAGIALLMGMLPGVSNLFQKALGQNEANKFIEKQIKKYGATAAAQMMQNFSQSVAGEIALSALRDGGEAFAADALQFLLKKGTYDPDAQFDAVDAWHDFLAAATLGGFGKLAEPLGNANQAKEAAASFRDQLLEALEQEMWKRLEWYNRHK